jgi:LuxR family maltose regulon positive regulatory protein
MSITLRDARITMPQLPPGYVSRPRLLARLNRAADLPLTLVCAGPGAGKTVLLADWAQRVNARVVWLSPTAGDADPGRFARLLRSALRDSSYGGSSYGGSSYRSGDEVAGLGGPGGALDELPAELADPWQEPAQLLYSQVAEQPVPLVVIIDDVHLLSAPGVLDGLDSLIRSPVPGLRLVLAGRSDPPLPLHKYRLAGQLLELRGADLAMTPAETREILTLHGVGLAGAEFGVLLRRTEGWAAGVRLSAMRMADAERPGALVSQLAMGPGSIGEYLVGEVLDKLTEQQRRLLIETSFLDEVTGPLADAVTGLTGAGEALNDLARRNSFVIPLDPLQTRYRYHRLFREVLGYLLGRRDGPSVQRLKQRAADWFEANDELSAAVHWTIQAGHPGPAAVLLARGGLAQAFVRRLDLAGLGLPAPAAVASGAVATTDRTDRTAAATPGAAAVASLVVAAICASPDSAAGELERHRSARPNHAATDPALAVAAALAELLLGQQAGDADTVDAAARRLLGQLKGGAGPQLGHPGPQPGLRAAVLLAQACSRLWAGRRDDIDALLAAALDAARGDGLAALELEVLSMMALTECFRSRIGHADEAAHRARAAARAATLDLPPALELTAAVRAQVTGDAGGQARALQRVVPASVVGADPGLAVARALGEASVRLAREQNAEARSILLQLASRRIPPLLAVTRDVMLADLDTSLGRPRSALTLLDRYQGTEFAAHTAAARARAHLALSDKDRARECVRNALTRPSAQISRLHLVAVLLQDARIAQADGEPGRAVEALSQAIEMARGEIVQPFLQAGSCFADLLARHPEVADRWPVPVSPVPAPAVTRLPAARTPVALTDPLTQRELTILRLLTTSMSTGEIAAELCLSVNTVKTHLAAIYRKLLAGRRREAVQRARELELI